jgi:hypothetical protein
LESQRSAAGQNRKKPTKPSFFWGHFGEGKNYCSIMTREMAAAKGGRDGRKNMALKFKDPLRRFREILSSNVNR